jgi:hypothetical protein
LGSRDGDVLECLRFFQFTQSKPSTGVRITDRRFWQFADIGAGTDAAGAGESRGWELE